MSLGLSDTPLPAPADQQLGRLLAGRYRLGSVLGSGAVGVVYGATDQQAEREDRREVAIKLLAAHDDVSGQTLRRFQREGAALQKLRHPGIVRVFDSGSDDSGAFPVAYIAMERLEGETLSERIEREGILPRAAVEHIAMTVLDTLAFAHGRQVVHRDLKPSNIFLCGRGDRPDVKLLDFGLAKFLEVEPTDSGLTLTRSGMVLGTPLYMAPEQCAGDRVDLRVDVYAAGCLLYEMLTGEPPYLLESQAEVVRAHLVTPVPVLPGDGEDGSRGPLSAVIATSMAKRPEERFEDAAVMHGALREAFDAEPGKGSGLAWQRARLAARAARMWRRRSLRVLSAALVAGILVLSLLVARGPSPAPPARADLWEQRGVPEELRAIHAKVTGGKGIAPAQVSRVRRYARAHRGDPRPYILLGKGFANQGWRKDAIVRYRRAFEVDPSALQHASMLDDLIGIAEGDKYAKAAADAIVEMYGHGARAEVEAAMEGRPDATPEHERLAALLARLVPEP